MNYALELLKKYVGSSEPELNTNLRKGNNNYVEVEVFDSLFELGNVPSPLYRFLPNEYVTFDDQKHYADKAYLSSSLDFDAFIIHVPGSDIACIKICVTNPIRHINVKRLLPNYNNEEEFILPRDSMLTLYSEPKRYNEYDMESLLTNEGSIYSVQEITGIYGIKSITLYNVTIDHNNIL